MFRVGKKIIIIIMAKAKTNYVYHSYKTTGLLLVLYVQCMSFFVNWKLETSSTTILKNFHPLITLAKILTKQNLRMNLII